MIVVHTLKLFLTNLLTCRFFIWLSFFPWYCICWRKWVVCPVEFCTAWILLIASFRWCLFNMFLCLCISCIESRGLIDLGLFSVERQLREWWVVCFFIRRHIIPTLSINFLGTIKWCYLSCLLNKLSNFIGQVRDPLCL